jgi:site-specific DNA-methyltransferase (adenine-specific)
MSLLIHGDALDVLRLMPSESVNVAGTSVPYFWLRDYEVAGQIGREDTVQQYLERLWLVFDEVRRVLTRDGNCFVNIGDKYLHGCLQLIPHEFATGMKKRGWLPQNDITWRKTNCMPHSDRRRFPSNSEAVYFFSKSRSHYFSPLFEPYARTSLKRFEQVNRKGKEFDPAKHKHGDNPSQSPMAILARTAKKHKNLNIPGQKPHGMHVARANGHEQNIFDPRGRRMKTVWDIAVARLKERHFAAWPPELVRRMIMAACPPGGVVLDPFLGSGTTLIVAEDLAENPELQLSCTGIGIDISEEFLAIARQLILEAREKRAAATCRRRKR